MAEQKTGVGGRYYIVDGKRLTEKEFLAIKPKSSKHKTNETQQSEVKADE